MKVKCMIRMKPKRGEPGQKYGEPNPLGDWNVFKIKTSMPRFSSQKALTMSVYLNSRFQRPTLKWSILQKENLGKMQWITNLPNLKK